LCQGAGTVLITFKNTKLAWIYCHVSGICVTNKAGFWIWVSNLLNVSTTGYNSSQITIWHCHRLLTGQSTGTVLTSNWTPLYSFVLLQFWSELRLTVPSYNFSAQTPRKTPSSFVKNACLLVRYLAMDVLLLLRAYASVMCLPSRCLAMDICVTIYYIRTAIDVGWDVICVCLKNPVVICVVVNEHGDRMVSALASCFSDPEFKFRPRERPSWLTFYRDFHHSSRGRQWDCTACCHSHFQFSSH
jgi:hypothetical protein